jgi:hypothetical protein
MIIQQVSFPLNNNEFLKVISNSFNEFINCGTSRSTAKLKPLHGAIAKDLLDKLGNGYSILSQGILNDKEGNIKGRYIDKKVDITVTKNGKAIAGIGVKFVMQNYSQNSNNYFENMLGETANIRCNQYPYFQVFIILDKLPYYDNSKNIKKWEEFTAHNAAKYITLSQDNIDAFFHTPNKTLIYIVHIPPNNRLSTKTEYMDYYKTLNFQIAQSSNSLGSYGNAIIVNNYELFRDKVYHTINAL